MGALGLKLNCRKNRLNEISAGLGLQSECYITTINSSDLPSLTVQSRAASNTGFISFSQYFSLPVNFLFYEYSISVNQPYNEEIIIFLFNEIF